MAESFKASNDLLRRGLELTRNSYNGPICLLSECLAEVDSPEGRKRLEAYLESEPFTHFKAHPTKKHVYERIEVDGARSFGRFVDREWVSEP